MYAAQDKSEVSIEQYLDVLRRRWVWVVIAPVVLVGLTLFSDLRAVKVYQASSQLLLQSKSTESIFSITPVVTDPSRAIQNELKVINSRTVREAVAKKYGKPIGVRAIAGGDDDVIILSATASTGEEAARRVNAYATVYQQVRLEALVEDLANAKKIVQQQVDDYQKQIDAIDKPLVDLDAQIVKLNPNDPAYVALVATRDQVKQRTDAQRTEAQKGLTDYQQRLQLLQLSERLTTSGGIQILNPASAPSSPIAPTITRDVLQSLFIGIFVGIGLAFVRDQLDDSVRSKADVERAVKDLPTLGLVPFDNTWRDGREPQLVTITAPMSATAEAYRGLRTAIQYASLEKPMRVIQITSSSASEGKTTLIANLAVAFAQAGKRVCVLGCDLRKPRIHQFLQVDPAIGFTSVLLGDLTLEEAIQQSPLHPNIDVLASGPRPPNPSELLSIDRAANLIRSLGEQYSIVFIDCPPVLPVTDSLVLARCVDATIFMAAANRTTRRTARRAVEMLRQVGSPLLGTVVNGVAAEDTYGSLYEYYGYVRKSRVPFFGRFMPGRQGDIPSSSENVLPQEPEVSATEGDADHSG